ncbi:MAG: cation-transporting P-type ATPase [Planctomycetota bacterium]
MNAPPWSLDAVAVAREQRVDPARGLDPAEVARRRAEHGPNHLAGVARQRLSQILLNQIKSLIALLLLGAAGVSLAFGEHVEAAAIGAALLVNTAIGFVTELRAVRSMEALNELNRVTARALRAGHEVELPAEELVPGDVVLLEGGDLVTADLRLVEGANLEVDESALSGESLPVTKDLAPVAAGTLLADRGCMLHKGTSLTRGFGRGVVVATGARTELGKVAALVAAAEDQTTPLEQRLERLGRRLVGVALVVAAGVTLTGFAAGRDLLLTVETGIALAVAAIPEGLLVVATMALARGMWRLARRDALIRNLAAVETLGATTLILTDKTGTLTENRLALATLALAEGEPLADAALASPPAERAAQVRAALTVGALCGHASVEGEQTLGDPLEVALLLAAQRAGLDPQATLAAQPRVREEAFDPALRLMATVHTRADGAWVAVKGAPEAVLEAATHELRGEGAVPLGPAERAAWEARGRALAERGLRVLALAEKQSPDPDVPAYQDLVLLALVGLQDPPRQDVAESLTACRAAGVRVVMATGDQGVTAGAIADALQLREPGDEVVTGDALDAVLADPERLRRVAVFARVDPAQKLALVEAYQRAGEVVAMTGDGVNDAPALRRAEIGVAMGRRGTQVAREAADMVLRDDSFASIVVAIRQGRVIFANIRKFVLYLLSCNAAEIGVIAGAAALGLPLPLLPLQLLYLNLVTDVFPALALGFGEGDPRILERPPRDPREPFVTGRHWRWVSAWAAALTVCVLGAQVLAQQALGYDDRAATSVAFLTLGFAQLLHVFNMRDSGSSFLTNDVLRNPHVWGSVALCTGLLLASSWLRPLGEVLSVSDPDPRGWALIAGFALVPWALGQLAHGLGLRPREGDPLSPAAPRAADGSGA